LRQRVLEGHCAEVLAPHKNLQAHVEVLIQRSDRPPQDVAEVLHHLIAAHGMEARQRDRQPPARRECERAVQHFAQVRPDVQDARSDVRLFQDALESGRVG